MKVKLTLNSKEIREILYFYFTNHRDAYEPNINIKENVTAEIEYDDYSIEEGML